MRSYFHQRILASVDMNNVTNHKQTKVTMRVMQMCGSFTRNESDCSITIKFSFLCLLSSSSHICGLAKFYLIESLILNTLVIADNWYTEINHKTGHRTSLKAVMENGLYNLIRFWACGNQSTKNNYNTQIDINPWNVHKI
jgi:hypothetical protein